MNAGSTYEWKKKAIQQSRQRKSGILFDEMEAVTSLHRKSLVRLMTSNLTRCLLSL